MGYQVSRHRRRPGRLDRGLRSDPIGLQRHHLRVPTASGRHAPVWHPRLPPAQGRAGPGDPVDPGHGIMAKTGIRVSDPKTLSIPASKPCSRPRGVGQPRSGHRRRRGRGSPAGLDFLRRVNSGRRHGRSERALSSEAGNVAMDAARCARRLPGVSSVHVPGLREPRGDAGPPLGSDRGHSKKGHLPQQPGPTRIETSGEKVTGVSFRTCTRVFDEQGRFAPQFDDSKTALLATDTVIRDHRPGHRRGRTGRGRRTRWTDRGRRRHPGHQRPGPLSRVAMPCWDRLPWSNAMPRPPGSRGHRRISAGRQAHPGPGFCRGRDGQEPEADAPRQGAG